MYINNIQSIIIHIKKKQPVTKNIRANIHCEKKINKYLKYQNVYQSIKSIIIHIKKNNMLQNIRANIHHEKKMNKY
jgi:hypothetical protein